MNNITTALTILLTIALCVHPGKAAVSVMAQLESVSVLTNKD